MKLTFKLNGKSHIIEFNTAPTQSGGISCMAKTSKDLDVLQYIISESPSMVVPKAIQQHIEKTLKLPIEIDRDYRGAGFGFKLDMYALIQKL